MLHSVRPCFLSVTLGEGTLQAPRAQRPRSLSLSPRREADATVHVSVLR